MQPQIQERRAWSISGALGLILSIFLLLLAIGGFGFLALPNNFIPIWLKATLGGISAIVFTATIAFISSSIAIISPGQTRVIQFFGKYVGTVRDTGLVMVVPLATKTKVSTRVHNFETHELKVNDAAGNPVNIAAIIVWQVDDTAKAVFAVEDYADFVEVQAESALRHVATTHPYDNGTEGEETLRGSTELVSQELADEVQERVAIAGIKVLEARISSLAYAPEIAGAMLQRQQAAAVIAAREKIVEGAVTMVKGALSSLESEGVVELDDERKAAMVSNLLVVLCSESRATPVVNAGTLYH